MIQKLDNVVEECMSLYREKVSKPTALIELSKTQWKRYCKNCIHVQGLHRRVDDDSAPQSLYTEIKFGSDISIQKCRVSSVNVSFVNQINFNKTKQNFVMITGDKESGKTTLIAKLQGNEDPKKGAGLEYGYIDVRDEYRDGKTIFVKFFLPLINLVIHTYF